MHGFCAQAHRAHRDALFLIPVGSLGTSGFPQARQGLLFSLPYGLPGHIWVLTGPTG